MARKSRAQSQDWQHLYKTGRWQRLRQSQLKRHPLCQCPHCQGQKLEADVVHHISPHKGDTRLFFNPSNLMSMNKHCHDAFQKSEEMGGAGFLRGCDEHGEPLSAEHEWHV